MTRFARYPLFCFLIALILCCLVQNTEAASRKKHSTASKASKAVYKKNKMSRGKSQAFAMPRGKNQASLPLLFVKPTDGELSSGFGIRKLGSRSNARLHKGVDFSAQRGTSVVASAAGVVTSVGRNGAYGNIVEIEHGNGVSTRYAHLDTITVRPGQVVGAGKNIGTVGRTGHTTGSNLHFEVLVQNQQIDPMRAAAWTWVASRREAPSNYHRRIN